MLELDHSELSLRRQCEWIGLSHSTYYYAPDGRFCLEALQPALQLGRPGIFDTDQGVQFTAREFTDCLERAGIRISMDGRSRALESSSNGCGGRSSTRTSIIKDYAS